MNMFCAVEDMKAIEKIMDKRVGKKYIISDLSEMLNHFEQLRNDFEEYILYPLRPMYDFFFKIGITDKGEMLKVLATLFYVYKQEINTKVCQPSPVGEGGRRSLTDEAFS